MKKDDAPIDYGSMLRNHSIELRHGICRNPSLVLDRHLIAISEHPDAEALAELDEQIRELTVVLVLRALTEDEWWAIDMRYASAKQGTPEARDLDKSLALKSFVRFETVDGDVREDLGKKDLRAYWDTASPGERLPIIALTLELKTFVPSVPFSVPQSLTTRR